MQRAFSSLLRQAHALTKSNNFVIREGSSALDFTVLPLNEKVFNSFDSNKDGMIDEQELIKCANILGLTEPDAHKLFQELDANNDGKISLDEFLDVMAHQKVGESFSFSSGDLVLNRLRGNEAFKSRSKNATVEAIVYPTSLSFGSPESDFCAPSLTEQFKETFVPNLSFSSPESDFCAPSLIEQLRDVYEPAISFSSPESDFCAPTLAEQREESYEPNMSFSSPESDFCAPTLAEQTSEAHVPNISYSSPESDFCAPSLQEQTREAYVPNLSFSSPESDFCASTESTEPEVINMHLATATTSECRVITEPRHPFRIVHVNSAWTRLCGFTQDESIGRSLNILQGPKTETDRLAALGAEIEKKKSGSVYLTNYSKQGRMFTNHLRVKPISDVSGQVTHLMGVLEEMEDTKISQEI